MACASSIEGCLPKSNLDLRNPSVFFLLVFSRTEFMRQWTWPESSEIVAKVMDQVLA